MSNYVVLDGDTFELVSRKIYGVETKASLIRRSNPGVTEPLRQATILNIPDDLSIPQDQSQQLISNDPAQVTVSVRGYETFNSTPQLGSHFDQSVRKTTQFTSWESITIKRSLDSLSTIAITAPFQSDNLALREFFKPFTYNGLTVAVGGNTLFQGTVMNITPRLTDSRSTVEITGYSTPGIMNDCTQPTSDYPLSWDNYTLQEIADDVSAAFGVRVQFDALTGDVFQNATSKPEATALHFLTGLAKQRGLVIADTRDGFLLFQKSTTVGFPVARLVEGDAPLVSVITSFNAQQAFSSITGLNAVNPGIEGKKLTEQTGILGGRFYTFTVRDTLDTSLEVAVKAKVGRMYANMVNYKVSVPTWFDPFGTLWTPNTTVTLTAPDAMIYKEYEFIIRSVELHKTKNSETATLELVLPGSFSGEVPAFLPWE